MRESARSPPWGCLSKPFSGSPLMKPRRLPRLSLGPLSLGTRGYEGAEVGHEKDIAIIF